jgi:hypothetical protein
MEIAIVPQMVWISEEKKIATVIGVQRRYWLKPDDKSYVSYYGWFVERREPGES